MEKAPEQANALIYAYNRDNTIREGDTVVIYDGAPDTMKQVTMKHGEIL
jgi:hypothetical protein